MQSKRLIRTKLRIIMSIFIGNVLIQNNNQKVHKEAERRITKRTKIIRVKAILKILFDLQGEIWPVWWKGYYFFKEMYNLIKNIDKNWRKNKNQKVQKERRITKRTTMIRVRAILKIEWKILLKRFDEDILNCLWIRAL